MREDEIKNELLRFLSNASCREFFGQATQATNAKTGFKGNGVNKTVVATSVA
jgi:hypothetical protein